ncbi:MAG: Gfo/Idh/MocA family protein [Candidatus Sumerlaeia bacterium]
MSKKYKLGIFGCGDFLRWQANDLPKSDRVEVAALYDPDSARAEKYAGIVGGVGACCPDSIFADDDIDIVCLFVPPQFREELVMKAVESGKHIIATKPLGSQVDDCGRMVKAVEDAGLRCGVFYGRTGGAEAESYKRLFEGGEVGKLGLYKQDWLHHYPEWNDWALDPEKNGGPFMDAMIHNLNLARYLMGRPATQCAFFSDSHAHNLKCGDTEFMKIDFEGNGSAHLFITWAADLEVTSKEGNYREHIDINYMVTDQGWRLTTERVDGKACIVASKEGKQKQFPIEGLGKTPYDRFAEAVESGKDLPGDIPDIRQAYEDIKIFRDAAAQKGQTITLDLGLS